MSHVRGPFCAMANAGATGVDKVFSVTGPAHASRGDVVVGELAAMTHIGPMLTVTNDSYEGGEILGL